MVLSPSFVPVVIFTFVEFGFGFGCLVWFGSLVGSFFPERKLDPLQVIADTKRHSLQIVDQWEYCYCRLQA